MSTIFFDRLMSDGSRKKVAIATDNGACPFAADVRIGLVIGTFAAVPYVNLHLENWKRHYPQIPLLIHDDGSGQSHNLAALCHSYGADFECNSRRLNPCVGDLSAFLGGTIWARERCVNLLVKMSRRFIATHDWTNALEHLARESQYHTFSYHCTGNKYGFRTECLGISVKAWTESGSVNAIARQVTRNESCFVEGWLHNLARKIPLCADAADFEKRNRKPHDSNGYADWPMMGSNRYKITPGVVWHDSHPPHHYARLATEWGLRYSEADFQDPNQGEGAKV